MTDEPSQPAGLCKLLSNLEDLYFIKDLGILPDQVLLKARKLSNAEAGSVYLLEKQPLRFT